MLTDSSTQKIGEGRGTDREEGRKLFSYRKFLARQGKTRAIFKRLGGLHTVINREQNLELLMGA